jgi:hypothetical protein
MFKDVDEFRRYVVENYPEVTDARLDDEHWDLLCTKCKVTRGFQLIKFTAAGTPTSYGRRFEEYFDGAYTYLFRCPVCKMFKQWIIYRVEARDDHGNYKMRFYRVTAVPSEGLEDVEELPGDPASLRIAYRQAIRAKDANAPLAAAAMFRRALQVITRDLLKAKPGNLANELNDVVGKTYNGTAIGKNFANVGYIIKEAGNQGAHADKDPDLLDFTPQDAEDLQDIFMELVSELFIIPVAIQKAKDEFLARKKITPKL